MYVVALQVLEASFAFKTALHEYLLAILEELFTNFKDYGPVAGLLLYTVTPEARYVAVRVRKHVIGEPLAVLPEEESAQEAWKVKESYAVSFNMIAIAVSDEY